MTSKKEFMDELVKANDLDEGEDIYQLNKGGKKIPIITRTGIEKIQYNNEITVTFEWISVSKDYACIKATATKGDLVIETFGSAWHGQGGNCMSNYVLEMSEKRGLARAVLKAVGAGKHGIYGKDESDDF